MKELVDKYYKVSIALLSQRVNYLMKAKKFLEVHTKDPDKSPEIIDLKNRLRPLQTMLSDLREVTKEVDHYYEGSWWRSEKYTLNQRKSRKFVYSEPIYDETFDEFYSEGTDEETSLGSYGYSIDRPAKANC